MPKKRPKPGSQQLEQRVFILCEGKKGKSEFSYYEDIIRHLNLPRNKVLVKVVPTAKNTGRELVREASTLRELPRDVAWVAYDKDGYTLHGETFSLAAQKGVRIAFSSVCFEQWILLHFGYTTRSFGSCDELLSYLRAQHGRAYSKAATNLFELTVAKLDEAKANALRLIQFQKDSCAAGTPIYDLNPYTNVVELIQFLESLKE